MGTGLRACKKQKKKTETLPKHSTAQQCMRPQHSQIMLRAHYKLTLQIWQQMLASHKQRPHTEMKRKSEGMTHRLLVSKTDNSLSHCKVSLSSPT